MNKSKKFQENVDVTFRNFAHITFQMGVWSVRVNKCGPCTRTISVIGSLPLSHTNIKWIKELMLNVCSTEIRKQTVQWPFDGWHISLDCTQCQRKDSECQKSNMLDKLILLPLTMECWWLHFNTVPISHQIWPFWSQSQKTNESQCIWNVKH